MKTSAKLFLWKGIIVMNAENTRIGIIGLGSMSSAIVKGFITYGGIDPTRITASARNRARLESNCKTI